MGDDTNVEAVEWPSVDDVLPVEEGGPAARTGFNYQDEIAVSFLLDMLECPEIEKTHCETHDDIVVVRTAQGAGCRVVEYVQVKGGEPDTLWSVAAICLRKNSRRGTSIFESSLSRDRHKEDARFRIVTLRDVNSDLKLLTFGVDAPAREPTSDDCQALLTEIERRCPEWKSEKGTCAGYWVANCRWDVRHSEKSVRNQNQLRILQLSAREGRQLLSDQAELLLGEFRLRAKEAGDAKWKSERHKKIITRDSIRAWWEARTEEIFSGASSASGGKLRGKMDEALLPHDVTDLAVHLRRRYARFSRSPKYMEAELGEYLAGRVESELLSLRSKLVAGELDLDGRKFHALCIERLDKINSELLPGTDDQSAFLKGCMYDIADRCLVRFVRPQ